MFLLVVSIVSATSASLSSSPVRTSLTYRVNDGSIHWELARELEDGEEAAGGTVSLEQVFIEDGRGLSKKLDGAGFELFEAPTSLSTKEFYDAGVVKQAYYAEIASALKKLMGCAHVHVFSHSVRNGRREGELSSDGVVQGYGFGPHVDVSAHEAHSICIGMRKAAEREYGAPLQGRCVYVNAWRNIDDKPVENDPFAVCDATSVVAPDDYVNFHLDTELYGISQYRLGNAHASRHKWYYFPRMTREEVLVFKQWDSDPTVQARICFHSAFQLPSTDRAYNLAVRQSCEVRALCFFPGEDDEP